MVLACIPLGGFILLIDAVNRREAGRASVEARTAWQKPWSKPHSFGLAAKVSSVRRPNLSHPTDPMDEAPQEPPSQVAWTIRPRL